MVVIHLLVPLQHLIQILLIYEVLAAVEEVHGEILLLLLMQVKMVTQVMVLVVVVEHKMVHWVMMYQVVQLVLLTHFIQLWLDMLVVQVERILL